jgi:tetratricopeptide (TPR) repeat protein
LILLANNYTWQSKYDEADKIYSDLAANINDPNIYYEWGHIKYAQGDVGAAITRFKRAADSSDDEQYWLVLLEKSAEQNDRDFRSYYQRFEQFASPYHKTLAKLYMIDYWVANQNYSEALADAEDILNSEQTQLRAKATYKKAEIYYHQGNYEDALSNFLRIRYIFNEYSELRWDAEFYIAKVYIAQGEKQRARTHFDSIRANMSQEQIDEFNALVN